MRRPKLSAEEGSASLEFITAGVILLVPSVYLVLAISTVQSATFAVEGAARQAARVFVTSDSVEVAQARADQAIAFGFSDYGLDSGHAEVSVRCSESNCLSPDSLVTIDVRTVVAMPLIPPILGLNQVALVPVSSSSTAHVSRFHGAS